MMRRTGMALLCGLATVWLVGCNKPCATTADCNSGDVCSAAICRALSCEEAIFAKDPKTGACVALSGCFLTAEQQTWQTCQDDPCAGLAENSCLADSRCQPSYATPDVENPQPSSSGGGGIGAPRDTAFACGGITEPFPPPVPGDPNANALVAGVNNGDQPKHGAWDTGCLPGSKRAYAGCRSVPQVTPQQPCGQLTTAQCGTRRDCSTTPPSSNSGGGTTPVPLPAGGVAKDGSPLVPPAPDLGQCFDLHPRSTSCDFADAMSCLTNPECQAIGARCYCPPGASCDCTKGTFLACQKNDHLRRCAADSECGTDERCDNTEDCIMPRVFSSTPTKPDSTGGAGCLGACVPKGCTGMGENMCNTNPACDAGTYGTVCHPQPYCKGGMGPIDSSDPSGDGTGSTCGCVNEFIGCAAQSATQTIRPDRSLLVRDPEIIDDPTFSLLNVLTALAPAGKVDSFALSLLSQVGASKQVASGAITKARTGFGRFYTEFNAGSPNPAQRFASMMATTALINRLDLASSKDCGEARLSFAMTSAYTNGDQRMTMIVEIKVPDDGNLCKTVAQQWADLSATDDVAQRRSKLIAIYTGLLKPANLGQIRTNEFVNRTGLEPWELREFHINSGTGLLDMVPVAQTVDPNQLGSQSLLSWISSNAASLQAGTAVIPAQYLAGASTEDGARLRLSSVSTDPTVLGAEKSVNSLACAGCHLTETKSPFVHIGERLATKVSGSYRATGRAVIDDFLQKELPKRQTLMQTVLTSGRGLVSLDWRPAVQARVH